MSIGRTIVANECRTFELVLTSCRLGGPEYKSTLASKISFPSSPQTLSSTTEGDLAIKVSPGAKTMMGTASGMLVIIMSVLLRRTVISKTRHKNSVPKLVMLYVYST